jgi:hypothetical protein
MNEFEAARLADLQFEGFEKSLEGIVQDAVKLGRTPAQIQELERDWHRNIRQDDFRTYLRRVCRELTKVGWHYHKADVIRFILETWPAVWNPNKLAQEYWRRILRGEWTPGPGDEESEGGTEPTDQDSDEEDGAVDRIIDEGEVVFTREWDTGAPLAGAGSEQVYRLGGYYALCSTHIGRDGPIDSLEEALDRWELLQVRSGIQAIESSELTSGELVKVLTCPEEHCEVAINGEDWTFSQRTGFRPRKAGKGPAFGR